MLRAFFHFFALAAVIFAGTRWLQPADPGAARASLAFPSANLVAITEARRGELRAEWLELTGDPPSPAEMQDLIEREFDDEILFREALAIGLHETDIVVRRRLVQNMLFLDDHDFGVEEAETLDDEERLVKDAIELGMHRSDVVVRRRLIQRMQAALEVGVPPPSDAEIRAFLETRPDRAISSARYRLSYAFESAGSTGTISGRAEPNLPLHRVFSVAEAERAFGDDVATRLEHLRPGERLGPFDVPQGRYLLRLDEVIPAAPHAFSSIRGEIAEALMVERRRRARSEAMARLRRSYRIDASARTPQASSSGPARLASEPTT